MPLASERRLEILEQLQAQGAVRVTSLAEQFEVAEETIRRDLDKLSQEGRLSRTHGGALSIRNERFDLPLAVRKQSRAAEKRAIAHQALTHIEPNDVVAFDASTTVLELAYALPDVPITVVTYALDVARLLVDRPQIEVICLGGELDSQSVCLLGPIAEANMKQFAIDKAFFSCKGIDLQRGCSEASTSHASIKKLLVQLADQSYLLADHSKFGVRSMSYFGQIDAIDTVIIDEQTNASFVEALKSKKTNIEIAKNADTPVESKA